jgi:outer membrane protein assembly factor BamB
MSNFKNELLLIFLIIVLPSANLIADDWEQWMGPKRDGVYRESGIIESIPESGLPIKWRTSIGGGYAGPAVADGRVFVFDYVKRSGEVVNDPGERAKLQGDERLLALDAATGKVLWTHKYNCPYSISYPAGPRCTPTVDEDRVYILGSEGDLKCLNVKDGDVVWALNLPKKFGCEVPIWGFSSHPLIDGDLLYTMVGGNGQGIVAFDKRTGEVRWKALDTQAGYAPPTIIEFGGERQLIVYHPLGVSSLNPTDGKEYWNVAIKPSYQMSIARPMLDGNKMYASGIGAQSVMIELATDQPAAKEVWRGTASNSIYSANATPLFVDGVLYGSDCQQGSLMAIDSETGERLWTTYEATRPGETRRVNHGTAFVTRIGDTDRYLILNELGELMMARLNTKEFKSLGKVAVLKPTGEAFGRQVLWSHPAYAQQTAFIRNDEEVVAVSLATDPQTEK